MLNQNQSNFFAAVCHYGNNATDLFSFHLSEGSGILYVRSTSSLPLAAMVFFRNDETEIIAELYNSEVKPYLDNALAKAGAEELNYVDDLVCYQVKK